MVHCSLSLAYIAIFNSSLRYFRKCAGMCHFGRLMATALACQKSRLRKQHRSAMAAVGILFCLSLTVSACSLAPPHTLELMPAPEVFAKGVLDPFKDLKQGDRPFQREVLFATDRMPDSKGNRYYLNKRGFNLRLGVAQTEMGHEKHTREEALRISLLNKRPGSFPVKVTGVREIGILDRSFSVFTPKEIIPQDPRKAARRFAALADRKLAESRQKDIYIYVHGYRVEFSNPILVANELWHFMGYDGLFMAFSWPSTPEVLAYTADVETTAVASLNLRFLLEYLSRQTKAEKIHIIGYSAGTRVVIGALAQLALMHSVENRIDPTIKPRLGQVILVGSDFDRQLLGAYLAEGLLSVFETLTIYISERDSALGMSEWVFGRQRLGQTWARGQSEIVRRYLMDTPALRFINVTRAEGADRGNGHGYFRNSPWASSDIMMSLMFELRPGERGLTRARSSPIWTFPPDYLERLDRALRAKSIN
jgi:esterase/lipase superfamily enzyme